jgi:hypothetical protein
MWLYGGPLMLVVESDRLKLPPTDHDAVSPSQVRLFITCLMSYKNWIYVILLMGIPKGKGQGLI